jgi:acetoin utilization deacetylase AcuC-like enzyme
MVALSEGYSPSAQKPAAVVADWIAHNLPLTILPVVPATLDEFALAHNREFVNDVLAGRRANGFGNRSTTVAASLPYTTGALLTASRHVLRTPDLQAACAPCSGFHHSSYANVAGFCTFNGLVVTAFTLLQEGLAQRIAIIDCDQHYGDGTDEILRRGVPRGEIRHFTAGMEFSQPIQINTFFKRLEHELAMLKGFDLVLYQAGADPHVNDPLGGWMTDEQLRERDARVFEGVAKLRVPLVWNLAGGYQRTADGGIEPVLAIHRATAIEHLRVFCA